MNRSARCATTSTADPLALVLDASAALGSLLFADAATQDVATLMRLINAGGVVVPMTFMPEILQVLVKSERRIRGNSNLLDIQLQTIRDIGFTIDDKTPLYLETTSLPLARTHRLSIFDATYLELAMRLSLPLATFDNGLTRAAQTERVPLLP
jgi:predicted nucleic acid-binding protein